MPVSKSELRWLNVKTAIFAGILGVLAALSGYLLFKTERDHYQSELSAQHSEVLRHAMDTFYHELVVLEDILNLVLSDELLISGLHRDYFIDRSSVSTVLKRYARVIKGINSIRWIDDSGMEQVRVDVSDTAITVVPQWDLQSKADRYYFQDGMRVAPPRMYLSPIDLNVENGQIIEPFQPAMRLSKVTGVRDRLKSGLFIINYDLSELLASVAAISSDSLQLQLSDQQGYWLVHPDTTMTWGDELGQLQNNIAAKDPALWSMLSSQEAIDTEFYSGGVVSYERIPIYGFANVYPKRELLLVSMTPAHVVQGKMQRFVFNAVSVGIIVMLLGAIFILRDHKSRLAVLSMAGQMRADMQELNRVNGLLDNTLRQQQQLTEDLAETKRLSSLGVMVAGVAHELNTPIGGAALSVSDAFARLQSLKQAVTQGLTKSAFEQYISQSDSSLELARSNLSRATQIVKSFKRLTLERTHDDIIQFNLREFIEDLGRALVPEFKKKGVELEIEVEPAQMITTHPGILSQVLENLILNALSHGFKEAVKEGRVTVSAVGIGAEELVISVADNGAGVPEFMQDTIFQPFITSKRAQKHTGLGLHLVHQWVAQCLGGTIRLDKSYQKGARFMLVVPLEYQDPMQKESPVSRANNVA
ncbi:sensor histidine kinase [Aliagarivorans marinus]|uniref:sensor histidine kinase n=1 Tax=Aliagarivorans marinus TaxID=561965 RepID=UPI00040786CB|nr:HAMP domain-containing sensor histidine kinase [Aliagarivorans marinus]